MVRFFMLFLRSASFLVTISCQCQLNLKCDYMPQLDLAFDVVLSTLDRQVLANINVKMFSRRAKITTSHGVIGSADVRSYHISLPYFSFNVFCHVYRVMLAVDVASCLAFMLFVFMMRIIG